MSICTDNWAEVEAAAKLVLGEEIVAAIGQYRGQPHSESQLIAVLHQVQSRFGRLGGTHLDAVSQLMQIPAAKVAGVASFYHFFRLKPRGRFMINVCLGTACYVKGAERIAQRIIDELGITWGETSKDGVFTLEAGPLSRHLRPGPGGDDRRRDSRRADARPGAGAAGEVSARRRGNEYGEIIRRTRQADDYWQEDSPTCCPPCTGVALRRAGPPVPMPEG